MKKTLKRSAAAFGVFALVVGGYLGFLQLSGNFHEVLAGELYRSAQPTPADIGSYVANYNIRTIVNLRGENGGADWYQKEMQASKQAGVQHFDFALSASREVTPEEARQLIAVLKDAPKPILIHCQSGADRTGLISTLYLWQIAAKDQKTAEKQLSIRFGHIGIPYLSAAYAMDTSLEKLEKALPAPALSNIRG